VSGVTGWMRGRPPGRVVASHPIRCRLNRSAPMAASSGSAPSNSPQVAIKNPPIGLGVSQHRSRRQRHTCALSDLADRQITTQLLSPSEVGGMAISHKFSRILGLPLSIVPVSDVCSAALQFIAK
jgi:hypothetical protein